MSIAGIPILADPQPLYPAGMLPVHSAKTPSLTSIDTFPWCIDHSTSTYTVIIVWLIYIPFCIPCLSHADVQGYYEVEVRGGDEEAQEMGDPEVQGTEGCVNCLVPYLEAGA